MYGMAPPGYGPAIAGQAPAMHGQAPLMPGQHTMAMPPHMGTATMTTPVSNHPQMSASEVYTNIPYCCL